jgi:hypothetical protein
MTEFGTDRDTAATIHDTARYVATLRERGDEESAFDAEQEFLSAPGIGEFERNIYQREYDAIR